MAKPKFKRNQAIYNSVKEGQSFTKVAKHFRLSVPTVFNIYKRVENSNRTGARAQPVPKRSDNRG